MVVLETLQLAGRGRDRSVMFSPGRGLSYSDTQTVGNRDRLLHCRKKSVSIRLSNSVTHADASELRNANSSKKESKHRHLKSKRVSHELLHSVGEITKRNKLQLTSVPLAVDSSRESSGKTKKSCRIINLKIPLPDSDELLEHYYNPCCKGFPRLQSKCDKAKLQESRRSLDRKHVKKKFGHVDKNLQTDDEDQRTSSE